MFLTSSEAILPDIWIRDEEDSAGGAMEEVAPGVLLDTGIVDVMWFNSDN